MVGREENGWKVLEGLGLGDWEIFGRTSCGKTGVSILGKWKGKMAVGLMMIRVLIIME